MKKYRKWTLQTYSDPWIGLPNRTRSAAHGWSASPAIYLKREILGIKPLSPRYRTFTITPHLCDLSEAFGAVCTPYGPIRAFVRVTEAGTIEIKYEAPKECEYVPQGDSYIRDDKIM